MKENIEEDMNRILNLIDYINNADYADASQCFDAEDISAIGNILSDYKRVLKENLRLRYQDIPYLEGEIKGYKTRIEELKYKYDRALEDLVKSKQKIKDKIEELEKFIYTGENAPQDFLQYRIKAKIQVLQELLEEE